MIKLHMPALVINEFEMAVDTCVMSIIGSCDTHYDYPTVGAMLLRRIGKFRRPFNAPAPSIVRDTCDDASTRRPKHDCEVTGHRTRQTQR